MSTDLQEQAVALRQQQFHSCCLVILDKSCLLVDGDSHRRQPLEFLRIPAVFAALLDYLMILPVHIICNAVMCWVGLHVNELV